MKERLQKYLSSCGIASRRKAEELIFAGRVKVNGLTVKHITLVDYNDEIYVDGRKVEPRKKNLYIMLNKPRGVITSVIDNFERTSVTEIIDIKERVFPVGRLDLDSSGLLLLTNDGDFANKIMHPSRKIAKVYEAEVKGIPDESDLSAFEKGIKIGEYITAPAKVKIINKNEEKSVLEITIYEGKKRQIRKMCGEIKHPVISLKRIKIGGLALGNLKEGEWRFLKDEEIKKIF